MLLWEVRITPCYDSSVQQSWLLSVNYFKAGWNIHIHSYFRGDKILHATTYGTQPNTTLRLCPASLQDCILCHHQTQNPLHNRLCRSVHPWECAFEIQATKKPKGLLGVLPGCSSLCCSPVCNKWAWVSHDVSLAPVNPASLSDLSWAFWSVFNAILLIATNPPVNNVAHKRCSLPSPVKYVLLACKPIKVVCLVPYLQDCPMQLWLP